MSQVFRLHYGTIFAAGFNCPRQPWEGQRTSAITSGLGLRARTDVPLIGGERHL